MILKRARSVKNHLMSILRKLITDMDFANGL